LEAQWQQVDFERGILFLPNSKTGRKPPYLNASALEVLFGLARIEGNPYIIAGLKDGAPRADLKKPWAAVTKVAGSKACAYTICGTRLRPLALCTAPHSLHAGGLRSPVILDFLNLLVLALALHARTHSASGSR